MEETVLHDQIIRQIEYYFGDINLPRDEFLRSKIKEDAEGWVPFEVLLTFNRLATLSKDEAVLAAAIEKAEKGLLQLSEDRKKVRRDPNLPVPEWNDARRQELLERTAYAKGFNLDDSLNEIMTFLQDYGPIESCTRRCGKGQKFKGSCFIIFKDKDTCKKFIDIETVKYKEVDLIRKWQNDYFDEKRKENSERLEAKKAKKQAVIEKAVKKLEFPKGATMYFSGIPEGKTLTREAIKEGIAAIDENAVVAFVDFSKGDVTGHLRMSVENGAVELFKKLTDGQLEIEEVKINFKVLEGDEEEDYLKKTAESVAKLREKNKNNRKRAGGFNSNKGHKKQRLK